MSKKNDGLRAKKKNAKRPKAETLSIRLRGPGVTLETVRADIKRVTEASPESASPPGSRRNVE
jgi:hypothetical protein